MNMRNLSLAATAVLALGLVGSASAADVSDDLTISGTVSNYCEIAIEDVSVNLSMAEGFTSKTVPMNGGLQVFCNYGTAYSVEPGQGANFDSAMGSRLIADGLGNTIPYILSQDPGAGVPWEIGAPITGVGTGVWEMHDFAVRFEGLDMAPAGAYTDTVAVTLTY